MEFHPASQRLRTKCSYPLWITSGLSLDRLWTISGQSLDRPWTLPGPCLDRPCTVWTTSCSSLDRLRTVSGPSQDRNIYAFFSENPETEMGFPGFPL